MDIIRACQHMLNSHERSISPKGNNMSSAREKNMNSKDLTQNVFVYDLLSTYKSKILI